jgi:3-deoxy-D-manno-octulosonic-acid transferase
LLSIIAPRHPQRGDSLVKQLTELDLTIARRSESQAINADTDIYLADTIGEMGLFYRLSDIAFIGGTVTPQGGQNPLEAARLDSAIFYGPSNENFSEMFTLIKEVDAGREIFSQNDMTDMVDLLLSDSDFRKKLKNNALKMIDKNAGATDQTLTAITPFLEKTTSG